MHVSFVDTVLGAKNNSFNNATKAKCSLVAGSQVRYICKHLISH
jgi:hypothetical protein